MAFSPCRPAVTRRAALRTTARLLVAAAALTACGGNASPPAAASTSAAPQTATSSAAGSAAATSPVATAAASTSAAASASAATTSAIASVALTSSSAGPAATPTPAAKSASGAVTTIVYGQTWDPGEGPYIKTWMERFNTKYAGQVKVDQGDQGDSNKVAALAASDTLPDILAVGSTVVQSWIPRGWVKNMQPYIDQDKTFDIADFTPPSLFAYRQRGSLYGLPFDEGPLLLWYNLDMFDAAGVKYPDESWTFDDVLNAAVKLTKVQGQDKVFGMASIPGSPFTPSQYTMVAPFGGGWVNDVEDQTVVDAPGTIQGMQWWLDLLIKNKAVPTADEAKTIQLWPFFAQRAAMGITGTWSASQAAQIGKFRYDVSHYPKGPKGRITGANGSGLTISKNTKAPDASWLFISNFLSKEGQAELFASNGRGSPARASAWALFEKSPSAMPSAKIILPILQSYAKHEQPIGQRAADMQRVVGPLWQNVLKGSMNVSDFASQAKGLVAPMLADNRLNL